MDAMTLSAEPVPLSGADRQRRYRERQRLKKDADEAVTLPSSDVTPRSADVTPPPAKGVTASHAASPRLLITPYVAAAALAGWAAYFVRGRDGRSPSRRTAGCCGDGDGAGKLVSVAFLARYRIGFPLRVTLVALVAGIAAINGLGVFSQLVVAHLGDRIERAGKVETGAPALDARVEAQAAVVADLDRRVAQIDSAIAEMIRRGKNALAAIDQQRQNRETLVARWRAEVEQLASLKTSEAAAKQAATVVQSETAPIAYVATMLGTERQDAVRWLILLMVLCADPLAIALTAAASAVRRSAG